MTPELRLTEGLAEWGCSDERSRAIMTRWRTGESAIEYLLGQHKLESLAAGGAEVSSEGLIERAALRLRTARAGSEAGDPGGAFVAAYDAYRMAADALLARQGLRATGGGGSHAIVEDAVSAQFGSEISEYTKPTFERLRRTRNAEQYFDPSAPEITSADAEWAIATAEAAIAAVQDLLTAGSLKRFDQT